MQTSTSGRARQATAAPAAHTTSIIMFARCRWNVALATRVRLTLPTHPSVPPSLTPVARGALMTMHAPRPSRAYHYPSPDTYRVSVIHATVAKPLVMPSSPKPLAMPADPSGVHRQRLPPTPPTHAMALAPVQREP